MKTSKLLREFYQLLVNRERGLCNILGFVIALALRVVWKPPYCQQLISNIENMKILMSKSFCSKKKGRWFCNHFFRIRFFVFVDLHFIQIKTKWESWTLADAQVVHLLFEYREFWKYRFIVRFFHRCGESIVVLSQGLRHIDQAVNLAKVSTCCWFLCYPEHIENA